MKITNSILHESTLILAQYPKEPETIPPAPGSPEEIPPPSQPDEIYPGKTPAEIPPPQVPEEPPPPPKRDPEIPKEIPEINGFVRMFY